MLFASPNLISRLSKPHAAPASRRIASLLAALAVVAASLAAIAVSQPATAQLQPLDPDLCATTYKPAANAGPLTEADCRTIVAWRNAVVSNPGSTIGANHLMARWGTGDQTKFNDWSNGNLANLQGVLTEIVGDEHVVTRIRMRKAGLAGPLPGRLPYIRQLRLTGNLLTGGFPAWLYGAEDLEYLSLRSNRLSGTVTGSALRTTKIVNFQLQHNRFSGPVPNFNFARLPKLTDLRLSNNNFSGPFPASWDTLATDGRGWQRLQVAQNNITGDMPSWVLSLKFANSFTPPNIGVGTVFPYYVDFRHNKLCIPSNFVLPDFKKLDRTSAPVQAYFGDNDCPTGQSTSNLNAPPGQNVRFEPVNADGTPTSDNPTHLKVTWNRPDDVNGTLTYHVRLHLAIATQDNLDPVAEQIKYCLGENINIPIIGPTLDNEFEVTIDRSNCTTPDLRVLFDPKKYTVSVTTAALTGGTFSSGNSGVSRVWSVYMADDAQKTYKDVAGVLGLDYQRNIWRWDAVNQVWQQRNQFQQDFASLNLEAGSALAMEARVPVSWLPLAGLSTADADTPVQLQNGWNVISAGGDAERGNEDGAFFIDDTLIDCNSAQGAITILRNVPGTQRFDIELPCHPSNERAFTRGQAYRTIGEIEELDTLFIYFRSVLPVTISWNATDKKYAPAS